MTAGSGVGGSIRNRDIRGLPRRSCGRRRGVGRWLCFRLAGSRSALPAQLDPHVVAAACRHHGEPLAGRGRRGLQLAFDRAVFREGALGVGGEQFGQESHHPLERHRRRRDLARAAHRHDHRPLADVQHQRLAVFTDDGGEEGLYEVHTTTPRNISVEWTATDSRESTILHAAASLFAT